VLNVGRPTRYDGDDDERDMMTAFSSHRRPTHRQACKNGLEGACLLTRARAPFRPPLRHERCRRRLKWLTQAIKNTKICSQTGGGGASGAGIAPSRISAIDKGMRAARVSAGGRANRVVDEISFCFVPFWPAVQSNGRRLSFSPAGQPTANGLSSSWTREGMRARTASTRLHRARQLSTKAPPLATKCYSEREENEAK
jgi:hypothetical protein